MNYSPPVNSASAAKAKLRRKDAATYMKVRYGFGSLSLLARLAVVGGGPKFQKFGSRVAIYDPDDIDSWIAERLGEPIESTSEE